MTDLLHLTEPRLLFAHGQALEDPRDGLTLFGPLDEGRPYGVRYGVIGTPEGIKLLKAWVKRIQRPIVNTPPQVARPPFSGFEATFRVPWDPRPTYEVPIPSMDLQNCVLLDDRHQRVFRTVDLYAERIAETMRQQEAPVDLWFVVIPDDVYKYCRPQATVEASRRIAADAKMSPVYAHRLRLGPSLFPEDEAVAAPYHYDVNFRNQLKARLLQSGAPTQIVRESTLSPSTQQREVLQSSVAWHLATATFYKTGGRPWKLGDIRTGVCYVGLVFKQDEHGLKQGNAACAAQMFLDSGDGMVFRGALGPWRNPTTGDFHLSREAAKELIGIAVEAYVRSQGAPPRELFVHGKVRFDDEEWRGFLEAVGSETMIVGVRITDERDFKLYRKGKLPVLRGLASVRDERTAFLWTKGYTPRLRTYAGREVPRPLRIEVSRGSTAIETVLADILALTKLNYNACIFADGLPVTLKFADAVGEILTAGPVSEAPPLPFKYYI
ncbi:MAG: hypothetical protein M3Q71_12170 [Chloroflexota bacterium]|nr:hypothetical protein [Chloroflexota bacterium]